MTTRLFRSRAVPLLATAGLLMAQAPVEAQAQATRDLDDYSYDDLVRELRDELYATGLDLDAGYPLDQLKDVITRAFSTDSTDPEDDIGAAELAEEMEEADTSLEAVIDAALDEADAIDGNEEIGDGDEIDNNEEMSDRKGSVVQTFGRATWRLASLLSGCSPNMRGCSTPRATFGRAADRTARTILSVNRRRN